MALKLTLAVAALLLAAARSQHLGAGDGNLVDDYYVDEVPAQRARPLSAAPRPTPVPILKQINRHNEDGSYTYGYEGADGTFKIETKFPTGDVKGKYGFVDDTGKVRVVEYGADRYGFQPAGEGITVAPPTLVDETTEEQEELQQRRVFSAPRPAPRPVYRELQNEEEVIQHRPPPPPQRSHSPVPQRALSIPGAAPAPAPRPAFVPSQPPAPARAKAFQPPPQQHLGNQQHFGPQQFAAQQLPPQRFATQQLPPQRFAAQQLPSQQGPRVAPPPHQAPRIQPGPAPQRAQPERATSILDRLAKDYALPAGAGAPLHDITFGYY